MNRVSVRQISIAFRALLSVITLLFIGFLLLMNGARAGSARQFPELAHLAWPVYIGVLIGFVPVFFGILNAWRWIALTGLGQSSSDEALTALNWITRCGIATWLWFSAGVPAWGVASHGMDPPFIPMWIVMSVCTWFFILLSALVRRALSTA